MELAERVCPAAQERYAQQDRRKCRCVRFRAKPGGDEDPGDWRVFSLRMGPNGQYYSTIDRLLSALAGKGSLHSLFPEVE